MKYQSTRLKILTALMAITIPGGCGTQIGNPGDDEDEEFLSAISNTVVLEVIAGLGTGEYLLSANHKTITSVDCSGENTIKRGTTTDHSQQNDLIDRTTDVKLAIERSVTDKVKNVTFDCSGSNSVSVSEFSESSQVTSSIDDTRERMIESTAKDSEAKVAHSNTIKTTGTRVLDISSTAVEAVQAVVSIDVEKTVQSTNLDPVSLAIEGQTIQFQATTSDSGVTYLVDDQALTGTTTAGDVTVRFTNVTFTPELKCYPATGVIEVDFADRGTFTLNVEEGYNSGFQQGDLNLFFAPDGCDLFEQ